jgi:FMN phosphatase YigB (HAD superfamily)
MRFLDKFSVLLLDMNGTFMFGHDRFGPEQDYCASYRALGGRQLDRQSLLRIIQRTCQAMLRASSLPERFDDFPTLAEALRECGGAEEAEVPILERLFAAHEQGDVPAAHAACLHGLARTHHLGVVSNLWARPEPWVASLRAAGLLSVFRTLVFSSEGRSIKPSSRIFERALRQLPPGSTILFAGDSLERDILPAKGLGLSTAWIAPPGLTHPAADVVAASLLELAQRSE